MLREIPSAVVAFSGGVDSALVLALASGSCAERRVLAAIGISPSLPQRERRAAGALARSMGVPHREVETREHEDPRYAANTADRCYHCKSTLFALLADLARAEGYSAVLDGVHLDDVTDHTGGMRASAERGVRSPLLEARLGKAEVRALARVIGLSVWDKPATACLASRIARGVEVTTERLTRVERAEDQLISLGFGPLRVRHESDEQARLELSPDDLPRAFAQRCRIELALRELGYTRVTIDPAGLRAAALSPTSLTLSGRSLSSAAPSNDRARSGTSA